MEIWTEIALYAFDYFNKSQDFSCHLNKNSWAFIITRKNVDPKVMSLFFYPWNPVDKKNNFYSATKIIDGKKDNYSYRIEIYEIKMILKLLSQIQYPFLKNLKFSVLKFYWKSCMKELIEKINHPSRLARHFLLGGSMHDF